MTKPRIVTTSGIDDSTGEMKRITTIIETRALSDVRIPVNMTPKNQHLWESICEDIQALYGKINGICAWQASSNEDQSSVTEAKKHLELVHLYTLKSLSH